MAIKKLNPYLMFKGTAAQAIKLYETALGGRVEGLVRFQDALGKDCPAMKENDIMHATIHIAGGAGGLVMVSDGADAAQGVVSNVQVALDFDDAADMSTKFEALGEGGKIIAPIADTFWGAKFGMLEDAFGIRWMFNCDTKKS